MIDYSEFDKANAAYERDVQAQLAKKDRENPGWDKEFMSRFTFKQGVMAKHREAMDAGRRRMYETSPGGTYDSFIEYNNPMRSASEKNSQAKFLQLVHKGNSEDEIRAMGYTGETPEGYAGHQGNPSGYGKSKYRPEATQGESYYQQLARDIDNPQENRIAQSIKKMQKDDPSLFNPKGTMYNLPTPGTPSYGRDGTFNTDTGVFTPSDGKGRFLSEAEKMSRDPSPDVVANKVLAYRNANKGGPNKAYEDALDRAFGALKSGSMRSDREYMRLPETWYGKPGSGSENWYPNPPGWNEGVTPKITYVGSGQAGKGLASGASYDSIKQAIPGYGSSAGAGAAAGSARERATQYQEEGSMSRMAPSGGGSKVLVDNEAMTSAPGDKDAGNTVTPIRAKSEASSNAVVAPIRSASTRKSVVTADRNRGSLTGGDTRNYYNTRFR